MADCNTLEIIKTIGTTVAAVAATIGAAFAVINWRKAKMHDAPRAFLVDPEPNQGSIFKTFLVVENRGPEDIRVEALVLTCGKFYEAQVTRDTCGGIEAIWTPAATRQECRMLVASKEKRDIQVTFLVNDGVAVLSARLVRKGSGYVVHLDAST